MNRRVYNREFLIFLGNLQINKTKMRTPKYANISKSYEITNVFSKTTDCWLIILKCGCLQFDRPLPPFLVKNDFYNGGTLIKYQNPKIIKQGVPSTPQHTDSHPCTRPEWSRSLSEWSCSLFSVFAEPKNGVYRARVRQQMKWFSGFCWFFRLFVNLLLFLIVPTLPM